MRAPTEGEIRRALDRVRDVAIATPLVPASGAPGLWLKPELRQPTGSFKVRGVYHWAAGLDPADRARGLSTHSAGNTALALGYVGRRLGVPTRSVLPDRTPAAKREALARLGVTPIPLPYDELLDYVCRAGWEDEPYAFLNPWADQMLLAGHATIGWEIVDECPDLQAVLVPVGGGALAAAVGSAVKLRRPEAKVFGVQPAACAPLAPSRELGRPVWVDPAPTVCDAVVPFVTRELFPILDEVLDGVTTVSEHALHHAIARLLRRDGMRAEGSGALALAAGLEMAPAVEGPVVCLLSGGNIGDGALAEITSAIPAGGAD